MKFKWEKKYLYWGITAFFVIVCSISFFVLLNKIDLVVSALSVLSRILMPFILGCSFAYLLNPVMDFIEKKWIIPILSKSKNKKVLTASRWISIAISLMFAFAILTGLFMMVIPQLGESLIHIVDNLPTYFSNLEAWILDLVKDNEALKLTLTEQFVNLNSMMTEWAKTSLLPQINSILSSITTGVLGVLTVIKNIFIGLIISVYVLATKERFFAQAKKLTYVIFPVKSANVILKMTRRSDKVFGGFIVGKIIDSAIIGLICFIGMSIFSLPFPLLISVIIGVTNVIPFFGPFIGAIPSGLLILMIEPISCLYFGIFILALQQFDGNILGPKILGDSTGLTAFWVMFAILIGGGMFGFVGMLIGVPAFAVVYSIISDIAVARLKKQELPSDTNDYYDIDYINTDDDVVYKESVDDVKKT